MLSFVDNGIHNEIAVPRRRTVGATCMSDITLRLLPGCCEVPTGDFAPARLALGKDMVAEFEASGRVLPLRVLQALELSVGNAWDIAAENAWRNAMTPRGVAFRSRPAVWWHSSLPDGLQLDVDGSVMSGWLAHPRLLSTVHHHFSLLLGDIPCYFCPKPDLVFATVHAGAMQAALRERSLNAVPIFVCDGMPSTTAYRTQRSNHPTRLAA